MRKLALITAAAVAIGASAAPAAAGWVCSGGWTAPPGCHWTGPPTPHAGPPPFGPIYPPNSQPPGAPALAYAPADDAPPPPSTPTLSMPDAPPPLGWLWGRGTACIEPDCRTVIVSVGVDGLNVRIAPNGPVALALANGVPVVPLRREGDWLLVAAACPLVPTFTWSVTAGIPLSVCL